MASKFSGKRQVCFLARRAIIIEYWYAKEISCDLYFISQTKSTQHQTYVQMQNLNSLTFIRKHRIKYLWILLMKVCFHFHYSTQSIKKKMTNGASSKLRIFILNLKWENEKASPILEVNILKITYIQYFYPECIQFFLDT